MTHELVSNCLKYAFADAREGVVLVEMTVIAPGQYALTVEDNGVGIPPDHLSKIFDPFFTTKSTSRGTGLGLAVTYGIMREHGGKISVESAVGKGSSFRLEFPTLRRAVHVS